MPLDLLAMKATRSSMSDALPGPEKRRADDVLGVEALQLVHAPQQPLLEIHHAIGICEVARQPRKGAFELAGAKADIAARERDAFAAALFLPERFAAIDREIAGVRHRVGDHRPVAFDLLFRCVLSVSGPCPQGGKQQRYPGCGPEYGGDSSVSSTFRVVFRDLLVRRRMTNSFTFKKNNIMICINNDQSRPRPSRRMIGARQDAPSGNPGRRR